MDPRNLRPGEPPVISVALVDDHEVVLAGIQAWCTAADPPITVRATCQHPNELVGLYTTGIDVIVLDLQFDRSGPAITTVRDLTTAGRRVIVYSMVTEPTTILSCLDLGVLTYLTKSEGQTHLVAAIHAAIHAAVSDTPYIGPTMAGAMAANKSTDRPTLSPREQEVLLQWFRTESKSLVAAALHLSTNTVNTHLGRVRTKYAAIGRPAPTKAALITRALQDGLINIDEL